MMDDVVERAKKADLIPQDFQPPAGYEAAFADAIRPFVEGYETEWLTRGEAKRDIEQFLDPSLDWSENPK